MQKQSIAIKGLFKHKFWGNWGASGRHQDFFHTVSANQRRTSQVSKKILGNWLDSLE